MLVLKKMVSIDSKEVNIHAVFFLRNIPLRKQGFSKLPLLFEVRLDQCQKLYMTFGTW